MRKGSDHLLNYRMKMGGVGRGVKHTAMGGGGVGTSGASGGQYISEMGYRDRATNSIAEDDEALDDESTSFAVTGTSGFFRKGMGSSTTISKIISQLRSIILDYHTVMYT